MSNYQSSIENEIKYYSTHILKYLHNILYKSFFSGWEEEERCHYKLKFEYQSQQMLISIFNKFNFLQQHSNYLLSSFLPYPSRPAHIKFISESRWTLFLCLWKSYLQCYIFHMVTSYLEPIPFPICKEQLFSSVGGGSGCRVSWSHRPGGITYKLLGMRVVTSISFFCFNVSKKLPQNQKLIGESKN